MFEEMSEKYAGMLRDESRLEGSAEAIACPKDIEQLVQTMHYAAQSGKRVTVQGAATGVVGGSIPQGGLLLSTRGMDRILGLREECGRFFLRAEAGVTLEQIDAYLRNKPYFFPPDPTEKNASLGGCFACNALGLKRMRYGAFSSSVFSLSWITPQGALWCLKRGEFVFDEIGCILPDGSCILLPNVPDKAVFNGQLPYPGMDLIDLLAGSEGRLGIAAEMELTLLPIPKVNWGVLLFFTRPSRAKLFVNAMPNMTTLTGCEYFDSGVLDLLHTNPVSGVQNLSNDALEALYMEFAGEDENAMEDALAEILNIFLDNGGREEDAWAAEGLTEMGKFRALCHAVHELVNGEIDKARALLPDVIKCDLDFQSKYVWEVLDRCRHEAMNAGISVFCFGHVLSEQAHVNLVPKTSAQKVECTQLIEHWSARIATQGGLLAVENGVGKLKKKLIHELLPPGYKVYYASVQKLFDPLNIMQNNFGIDI
ncbi:MAG: FAD-binding oxidoreductase [Oscillospiraceae bacterium]|nr:FAD-binding oxidoreductase [Oscillospiraceae bacterium]